MIDNKKDEIANEDVPSSNTDANLKMDSQKNPCENGANETDAFVSYDALKDICDDNVKFYENEDNECGQRFHGAISGIIDHIEVARKLSKEILDFVHDYDFDASTPGNGYRSFVKATRLCVEHSLRVSKHIAQNRTFIWFRKNMYMK